MTGAGRDEGGVELEAARRAELQAFGARLGHTFGDLGLLDRALTHKSRANEDAAFAGRDNEPLEFLGDAVVGFVVSDLLHRRDPDGAEGGKSFARAALVSSRHLARLAAELGLPELLRLGRGEEKTGGRKKATLWADAFEAVVAALYVDGGLEPAYRLIERLLSRELQPGRELARRDHKSALQERLQGCGEPPPEYAVTAEEGPGHRRRFRVECRLGGRAVSEGEGSSKKEAQQQAACRALEALEAERSPASAGRSLPPRSRD